MADVSQTPGATEKDKFDLATQPFLGRWHKLVSLTNWEKGHIIYNWRQAMSETNALSDKYSDHAWAERVRTVTPQHVGRLRRVYERFGAERESYEGLFWSHFQSALEWDDAEMWLEGASQNDWTGSEMRQQRADTLGITNTEHEPAELLNEDYESTDQNDPETLSETTAEVRSGEPTDDIPSEEEASAKDDSESDADLRQPPVASTATEESPAPGVQPFANLPEMPEDVAEAFDDFKLAIVSHRLDKFKDISVEDLLSVLDSLRQLVLAPMEK